ncbi:rCG52880 [Rattus norvegicus]|uniref:RCG52880 n=1 Tax=Rattus norvegicus TaxID=10116 RepID=A6IQT6_RAT|nr:rCG52880 [Rattus norvegicus]
MCFCVDIRMFGERGEGKMKNKVWKEDKEHGCWSADLGTGQSGASCKKFLIRKLEHDHFWLCDSGSK